MVKLDIPGAARGTVQKTLINKDTGEIVFQHTDRNLVVKTGRSEMVKLLAGTSELMLGEKTKIKKMAVGTGGAPDGIPSAPVDGNTSLITPVPAGKVDISSVDVDTSKTNPKVTFTALFDCDIVNAEINECGLFFNDGTTMYARHTFKSIPLLAGSNLAFQISWAIEL